jgi:hypothetical protein
MSPIKMLYPMLALVLLTLGAFANLLRARVRALRERSVDIDFYRHFSGGAEPDYAIRASRHYSNLFELPILFYASGAAAIALGRVNRISVTLAWAFVAARALHTLVHLGSNAVPVRLRA